MDTALPEVVDDLALFDAPAPDPGAGASALLADRFLVPPFSVLDRRSGEWQERKRRWLGLGIRSELGRGEELTVSSTAEWMTERIDAAGGGTSVFDPMLVEVAVRWYSAPGDRVLDPFAGGSVRGVVCSHLGRLYDGVDLRVEQVEANRAQAHLASPTTPPTWEEGDARLIEWTNPGPYDLILTCPPYAYLERYSDDPRDLSTMEYGAFLEACAEVWQGQAAALADDRFAVWVISDVRRKGGAGAYEGLVADTVKVAQGAGFDLYNDHIVVDPVGTLMLRAPRWFESTRKVGRAHQHLLVFVKGDARRAAKRVIA